MAENSAQKLGSDESTMELLIRVRSGDFDAADALLARCLPPLKRWAHGRLPMQARGVLDTDDVVQAAVLQMLKRLDRFEPHHVGAMQAYLRQSVINRIRDEVRRIARQPALSALPEDLSSTSISPLEGAIQNEAYVHYREALARLRPRDRALVVGRIELQWDREEMMERFGFKTPGAARVAVGRALARLTAALKELR